MRKRLIMDFVTREDTIEVDGKQIQIIRITLQWKLTER